MTLNKEEQAICEWIASQQQRMVDMAVDWSSINSGTFHVEGVNRQGKRVAEVLRHFSDDVYAHEVPPYQQITLDGDSEQCPLGKAILATKNKKASRKALLSGHLDTVFGKNHSFQEISHLSASRIQGPGIIDLKAGLVILVTALEAINSLDLPDFGWTVLLSPDEEIGSISSAPLLRHHAKGCQIGFVFEPPFQDGAFVSERGSSAYYFIRAEGRSAHVGRDYSQGRSAIAAIARLVAPLEALNSDSVVVNIGSIDGGSPSNVVPSQALIRMNVRAKTLDDHHQTDCAIERIVKENDGEVVLTLVRGAVREPKPFDIPTQKLFNQLKDCCTDLSITAHWRRSGGVCDGNILASSGLPTIDTLGARGGLIHTPNEYLEVDSLSERCQLTTLLLLRFARGLYNGFVS